MPELNVTIKTSGDKKYSLTVSDELTVLELKQLVAAESGIAADQQRLIFSGRILKDHDNLSQYKIKEGNFVHLVKGASKKPEAPQQKSAPAPTSLAAGQVAGNPLSDLTGARYSGLANLPPASMFGPDGGQGQAFNPTDISNLIDSNPEAFNQALDMISNDTTGMFNGIPREQRDAMVAMLRSPATRSLLMDPELMRRFGEATNEMQAMGFNGGAFGAGAFGASPGGAGGAGAGGASRGMPDSSVMQSLLGGSLGQSQDTRPPEERYETQLRQLNELGFFDFEQNVRALRRSGGHVEGAVSILLGD